MLEEYEVSQVRYIVVVDWGVSGGNVTKRAELTVPEGWLRPKGALATSTEVLYCSVGALFREQSRRYTHRYPLWPTLRFCISSVYSFGRGRWGWARGEGR